MKKEWKVRQALYHKLNNEHTDDLKKFKVEFSKDIIENAIKYFYNKDMGFIYPSKSYVVAICYAHWLSENFKEDFIELLNEELEMLEIHKRKNTIRIAYFNTQTLSESRILLYKLNQLW